MDPGMEIATAAPPPPSTGRFVFFNDRGLRAGWRLLIYVGILYAIYRLFELIAKNVNRPAGTDTVSASSDLQYFLPLGQGIVELVIFLVVLLISWIMSRIEHRKVGAYGLRLRRSTFPRFVTGYILWGFLPLSLLLLVMRAMRAFYFGSPSLHGISILNWAVLWGFAFLTVGLLEEYLFRGYALYTLADGIGFWPAAIVMSVLFARVHMGNGGETRIGIIGVFFFGLFAATTLWRTGNLWLAVGAHAGWDWGESFFYGVADSGFPAPGHFLNPRIHGPDWITGGSVGPEGSILTLILWALMTMGVLLFWPRPERAPAPRPEVEFTGIG